MALVVRGYVAAFTLIGHNYQKIEMAVIKHAGKLKTGLLRVIWVPGSQ